MSVLGTRDLPRAGSAFTLRRRQEPGNPDGKWGGRPSFAEAIRDDRGAILVAGVFMAILLAAGLFFLAGVGRALVYREGLQDSADAVAFTAAVYHARGMNLIAFLNILPAGLLFMLIGVKLVHGIGFIVRVAHCTYGGEACDAATKMENDAIAIENNVFPRVHDMLENLYVAQNSLAVGMPWVGTAHAAKSVVSSGGTAKFGVAVTPSLVGRRTTFLEPSGAEDVVSNPVETLRDVGPWPGLPLEDGDGDNNWQSSCRRNLPLLEEKVREVVNRYGVPITDSTEYVFASLMGGGLCGVDTNSSIFTAVNIDEERALAQRLYPAPKQVLRDATLGSDYFAVWSVVGGHSELHQRINKGVEIAGHGKAQLEEPPSLGDVQVAKAEFYFEPASPSNWRSIEPVAMWTLRWRARLRRVRPPSAEIWEATRGAVSMDVAEFATNRRGAVPGNGSDVALARAEAVRLLDAWFSAQAAGSTPESMNTWFSSQPGAIHRDSMVVVH